MFCLCATAALRLNAQTWVASTGTDAPGCGARTNPCATFAQAFSLAPAGGTIKAADAGNFGPLTVTHAITIDGSGVAVIDSSTADYAVGIFVGASDRVTIQGLAIEGANTAIEATGDVQLYLDDVAIRGQFSQGIGLYSSDGNGKMMADNVRVTANSTIGLNSIGFTVTVRNSVFACGHDGIVTFGSSGAAAGNTTVEHSQIAFASHAGISASQYGTVRIDSTQIINNQTGILTDAGGQVISYRTNTFANNVTDGTPSLSASQK